MPAAERARERRPAHQFLGGLVRAPLLLRAELRVHDLEVGLREGAQLQESGVPAEAHVVRGAHSFRRVTLNDGEEPPAAIDERPFIRFLYTTAADGP